MPGQQVYNAGDPCECSGLYFGVDANDKYVGAAQKIKRNVAFPPPPAGAVGWVLYRRDPQWTAWNSGLLALSLVIAVGSAFLFWIPKWDAKVLVVWALDFVAVALLLVNFGHAITGRLSGWLINTQFRMSLSRLQMFLWMAVVMSAFLTGVLANINTGANDDALAIKVPELLWLAMGISTTSLVGSGLILNSKKKKDPSDEVMENLVASRSAVSSLDLTRSRITDEEVKAAEVAGNTTLRGLRDTAKTKVDEEVQKVKDTELNGVLVSNEKIEDASPTDLVTGEEVGNKGVLEPTRFFNLVVTLILVGVYAVNLGAMLLSAAFSEGGVTEFPELGSASATLLTLSHAAYLADKVPDKEETNP